MQLPVVPKLEAPALVMFTPKDVVMGWTTTDDGGSREVW